MRRRIAESRYGLRDRIAAGPPILLDAAMGTELERRGVRTELPLWSARALLEAPEKVLEIHRENVEAGADVVTANTFRTHRRTLAKAGLGARSADLTRLAVALARRAAEEGRVLVAGSLSPLEDCYRPDLVPDDADLDREHGEQAAELADAGVDLILCETHNTIRELAAAVRAARATGLPVVASAVTDGSGRLLSGEPIEGMAEGVGGEKPDAFSINCVPARALGGDLERLAAAAPGVPLGAYANTGPPSGEGGTVFARDVPPEEYAALASGWLRLGARLVGSCCGTGAEHTRALRRMLDAGSVNRKS
jgi:S-methylmethionine-dependent homocysteine/selenocysteine methylase